MTNNNQIMIDFNYLDSLVNENQEKNEDKKYFNDIKSLEELKSKYLELVRRYHPLLNKDVNKAYIKNINDEYNEKFKKVKSFFMSRNGEIYEKENTEDKREFKKIINTVLLLDKNQEGKITLDILGTFIWIGGDTYPHKETFKKLGLRWSRNKQKWYKAPKGYRRYGKKQYSYNEIKNMYDNDETLEKEA